ncbi:MAG: hypothetical protein WBL36_02050, partial [Bacilli bacterium]
QWGFYYGCPSTTDPISGGQSAQMRWYKSSPDNHGYIVSKFNLYNVTRIEFKAANTSTINLVVSISIDEGATWIKEQTYILTASSVEYTYDFGSDEYESVRIKFQLTYDSTPSDKARLYIDDIKVYGYGNPQ